MTCQQMPTIELEKRVFAVMGTGWVTIPDIANAAGLERSTVREVLRHAVDRGDVVVDDRGVESFWRRMNLAGD